MLTSKQALRTPGLTFRFKRGGLIEVKRDGRAGERWASTSGRLTDEYTAAKVLTYRPTGGDAGGLDGDSDSVTYTINASPRGGGTTRTKATGNKGGTRTLGAKPAKRGSSRGGRGGKAGARSGSRGGDSLFGGI